MSVLSGVGVVSSSSSNRSVVVVGRDEPTVYDKRPDNDNFNSRFFLLLLYICAPRCAVVIVIISTPRILKPKETL